MKKWRAKHSKELYVILSKGIIVVFYDHDNVTGIQDSEFIALF